MSPDGKLLYLAGGLYELNSQGELKAKGIKFNYPKEGFSYTDGMRLDLEGNLYVSRGTKNQKVNGKNIRPNAQVHVFNPIGEHIKSIEVPGAKAVHNLCFGGPEGKTIYMIVPNGFIAIYENDIAGSFPQVVKAWAKK